MSTFTFDALLLQKLLKINQFTLPGVSLVFIGLRGAVLSTPNDNSFKSAHNLAILDVNYINPRCTILQWRPGDDSFAAFPASTVPHQRFVKTALTNNGTGANCLMTGLFNDYRKGMHRNGKPSGHEAFKQNAPRPIRRTSDDVDYVSDDRIEFDNPFDNLHCGWFDGRHSNYYASAGCQVIMGFPKCARPGREKNVGPWKVFHHNAWSVQQNTFPYILLTGLEVYNVASGKTLSKAKLRFGSSGPLVEKLQEKLKTKGFYEGIIDGDFGHRTLKAVIAFQKESLGSDGADAVVGPVTAKKLGI